MELTTAAVIALVVVLVLLHFGLARVFYDVRQLRRLMLEQMGVQRSGSLLRLPRASTGLHGRSVLALSVTCDACWAALAELADVAREPSGAGSDVVVLTYQDPQTFAEAAGDIPVVRDAEAWSVISHLSPPALLRVGVDGVVQEVALPTEPGDTAHALSRWAHAGVRA